MTRTIAVPLFALLLAAPAAAQAGAPANVDGSCAVGEGPRINVNVTGLKDRSGRLKLELYPANEGDFLKDDRDLIKEGKAFRRIWAETPASGPVTLCIRAPSAGRWAILFTHDRDGKNKFNFWKDGAGFPSTAHLGRSRPKVDQALIDVARAGTTTSIRAQYLRGLSGFAPIN